MNIPQEHLVRDEGVAGSNPATPTNYLADTSGSPATASATLSEPFQPANGTELISFVLHWCDDCARDAAFRDTDYDGDPALGCQILARGTAFAHDVTHPNYPKEWIVDEKGSRCTAHTTDPTCPVRCDKTIDMFEDAPARSGRARA